MPMPAHCVPGRSTETVTGLETGRRSIYVDKNAIVAIVGGSSASIGVFR